MINLFGIELDIIQIAVILGIIVSLILYYYPDILQRLGKRKYKIEIGDSYWDFEGVDGVDYVDAKLIERKRNVFGNWVVELKASGGIISLPNVIMDESNPSHNTVIKNKSGVMNGIVRVACNIDALGKPCKWNYRFDPHLVDLEKEVEERVTGKVVRDIFSNAETRDKFEGFKSKPDFD